MSNRWIIAVLLILLCAGGISFAIFNDPKAVQQLVIKIDTKGWTEAGRQEILRQQRISALPINWQYREILKQGKLFKQATPEMAKLALGEPTRVISVPTKNPQRKVLVLVYVFDANQRPTLLHFENGQLHSAQQGNPADITSMGAMAAASMLRP